MTRRLMAHFSERAFPFYVSRALIPGQWNISVIDKNTAHCQCNMSRAFTEAQQCCNVMICQLQFLASILSLMPSVESDINERFCVALTYDSAQRRCRLLDVFSKKPLTLTNLPLGAFKRNFKSVFACCIEHSFCSLHKALKYTPSSKQQQRRRFSYCGVT